jgi:serine/threonine protein kinase
VPQLIFEHRLLLEVQGHPGVPTVYWFGTHNDCNVLVMQCLGPQIMAVRADGFRPPMHIGIVRHVARCVLAALCTLHRAGFVHRDLKPENMLWESNPVAGSSPAGAGAGAGASGPPKLPKILVIDFGLAKRVGGHPSAFPHVRFRNDKHLTGTPRYAAINAHRGFELSRRDDIESFGYVMTFLALGSLPWQSLEDHPDGVATNFQDMSRQKAALFPEILCKDLPPAFAYTITYARSLSFDAMPDFDHLLAMWET